jgi:hypothetical protein
VNGVVAAQGTGGGKTLNLHNSGWLGERGELEENEGASVHPLGNLTWWRMGGSRAGCHRWLVGAATMAMVELVRGKEKREEERCWGALVGAAKVKGSRQPLVRAAPCGAPAVCASVYRRVGL